MQKQARQGDVLLIKIDSIPSSAKKVKNQIIAYGESSNHCHRVTDGIEVLEKDGEIYLAVNAKGKLEHVLVNSPETWTQEHAAIELEEGFYKVVKQVEYDPYEKHIRNVQD